MIGRSEEGGATEQSIIYESTLENILARAVYDDFSKYCSFNISNRFPPVREVSISKYECRAGAKVQPLCFHPVFICVMVPDLSNSGRCWWKPAELS